MLVNARNHLYNFRCQKLFRNLFIIKISHVYLPHFFSISIILPLNDGDFNKMKEIKCILFLAYAKSPLAIPPLKWLEIRFKKAPIWPPRAIFEEIFVKKRLPRNPRKPWFYWTYFNYSMIALTTPEPTVSPPSRSRFWICRYLLPCFLLILCYF